MINWTQVLENFGTAVIAGIGGALAAWIVSRPKERKAEIENIQQTREMIVLACQTLLRDRLQANYDQMTTRGWGSVYEKNNVAYLYKAYKNLGGNSYIEQVFQKIMDLPNCPPGEECTEC